jgi:hypothetical protein
VLGWSDMSKMTKNKMRHSTQEPFEKETLYHEHSIRKRDEKKGKLLTVVEKQYDDDGATRPNATGDFLRHRTRAQGLLFTTNDGIHFKRFCWFPQPDSSFGLLCCRCFIKLDWTQWIKNNFVRVSTVTGKR